MSKYYENNLDSTILSNANDVEWIGLESKCEKLMSLRKQVRHEKKKVKKAKKRKGKKGKKNKKKVKQLEAMIVRIENECQNNNRVLAQIALYLNANGAPSQQSYKQPQHFLWNEKNDKMLSQVFGAALGTFVYSLMSGKQHPRLPFDK